MFIENADNLSNDFACGKISFLSQERSQAKLAIHRATHLAGDADGRALPVALRRGAFFLSSGFAPVAGLAAVTLGHPDGLNTLTISKLEKITNRSIARDEALFHRRQP